MLCRTVEIVLLLGLILWPVYVYVCPVVHCQWGEWSHWSSCTASCGPSGTQDRERVIDVAPQCGGSACSGSSRGSRDCNRFCHNGGFLSTNGCSCSSEYTGNCCQTSETVDPTNVDVGTICGIIGGFFGGSGCIVACVWAAYKKCQESEEPNEPACPAATVICDCCKHCSVFCCGISCNRVGEQPPSYKDATNSSGYPRRSNTTNRGRSERSRSNKVHPDPSTPSSGYNSRRADSRMGSPIRDDISIDDQ